MVATTEVDRVYIHAPVVSPVVSERDDQLDAGLLCSVDYFIERCEVDCRVAILPPLEHNARVSSTFSVIVRKAPINMSPVLIVDAPGTEYLLIQHPSRLRD